jgi:hypothetical protein
LRNGTIFPSISSYLKKKMIILLQLYCCNIRIFQFEKYNTRYVPQAYLSLDHCTVGSSILLMTTINLATPRVFASSTCSRVCPPLS